MVAAYPGGRVDRPRISQQDFVLVVRHDGSERRLVFHW